MNSNPEIEKVLEVVKDKVDFTKSMVVDVGSGMGNFVNILSKKFGNKNIFGIESDETRLEKCKKKLSDLEKHFFKGKGENIPFKDSSVDVLVFQKSFHHIEDYDLSMKECERVLVPGGIMLIIEPEMKEGGFFEIAKFIHDEREIQRKAFEVLKKGTKKIKCTDFEKKIVLKVPGIRLKNLALNFFPDRAESIIKNLMEFLNKESKKKNCKVEELIYDNVLRINILEKQK